MKVDLKYITPIFILFMWGCESTEVDLVPPTFDASSYMPEPIQDDVCGSLEPVVFILNGGEDLSFDAVFADDVALSQYKVDIHNNFDCHGHGGGVAPSTSVPNVDNQTTDWTVLEIENIFGVSAPVFKTLNVPENVTAGNYHFHIQVIDESGNDNPFAYYHSLKIKNPLDEVPPQISIQEPENSSFTVQRGDLIRFVGQVTDDRSLSDGGNGVLYLAYTDLSSGNTFTTNEIFAFDENISVNFNFDFDYEVPQTLVKGSYRFSLGANDGVRNVAPFVFFDVKIN